MSDQDDKEIELLRLLEEEAKYRAENRMLAYEPYPKQLEWHTAGRDYRENALIAGNRSGKTYAAAFEVACHLTGLYPAWWPGRRFDRAAEGWAIAKTSELGRNICQALLFGTPGVAEAKGTGMVPKNCIVDTSLARGITDAYDRVMVRHVSGGVSIIQFKSAEQGKDKMMGATLDFVWCDEEPPLEVYTEAYIRLSTRKGLMMITYTPLDGRTALVDRLLYERTPDRHVVTMSMDDAKHFSLEEIEREMLSYPEHERDARRHGTPMQGEGRVWTVPESMFVMDPIAIPKWWSIIIGIDFGFEHPTAVAWLAWDKDQDIVYVIGEYRQAKQPMAVHVAAIRERKEFALAPVAWPHDGGQHDKGSGEGLADQYKKTGLRMLHGHAQAEEGGNSLSASIHEIGARLVSGRWKVFRNCTMWLEEYRNYHTKDGKIVAERDDLLSASRYANMMKRYARHASDCRSDPYGNSRPRKQRYAKGSGFLKRS